MSKLSVWCLENVVTETGGGTFGIFSRQRAGALARIGCQEEPEDA